MQTVCVELLTACVKIDRNTSIPQSLLATIHTGEEKTQAASSESPESSWGPRTSACLHSVQWNVLGKFGQVGKQVKLLWTLVRWTRIELRGGSELLTNNGASSR